MDKNYQTSISASVISILLYHNRRAGEREKCWRERINGSRTWCKPHSDLCATWAHNHMLCKSFIVYFHMIDCVHPIAAPSWQNMTFLASYLDVTARGRLLFPFNLRAGNVLIVTSQSVICDFVYNLRRTRNFTHFCKQVTRRPAARVQGLWVNAHTAQFDR